MIIYSVQISIPPMTSSDYGMNVGGFAWTLNSVQMKLGMVLLYVSFYLPFRRFRTSIIENHIYELAFS